MSSRASERPTPPARPPTIYRQWIVAAVLIVTVVAVFWPVHRFGFIDLDDDVYVTQNRHVQAGLTIAGIGWAFVNSEAAFWHPLTWLSHMVDCQLYGLAPAGHHVTNLVLHTANTVLLFAVLVRMTGAFWASGAVAGLFGLHPLRVESVAWVAERKDVLSGFFFLLTLWVYTRYVKTPNLRRLAATVMCFAAALMAKPMVVTLPFVLLLLDYWPLSRFGTFNVQRLTYEKLGLIAVGALIAALTILVNRDAMTSLAVLPFGARLENAVATYVAYLAKTFWPTRLAVFYPMPGTRSFAAVGGAALVLAGITTAAVLTRHRLPFLIVGWLWFIGTLVPVTGLLQSGQQAMADRFTYIPSIGLFIALVWGFRELFERRHVPAYAIAGGTIALLVALAATTRAQLGYWTDSTTLLTHTLDVTPPNALAHNNLGSRLARQGHLDAAITHFRAALEITPDYPLAMNNLGNALLHEGNIDAAASWFAAALRVNPGDPVAIFNIGASLVMQGRVQEAIEEFRAALRLKPDYADAHYNLGAALALQGNVDEAMEQFQQTIEFDPTYAKAYLAVGNLLIRRGSLAPASPYLRDAIRLDPSLADAHFLLAQALSAEGKTSESASHYDEAIRLKPGLVNSTSPTATR